MTTPQKSPVVTYADRHHAFIFVPVPDHRGRYLRTDKSVALVPCRQCKSPVGLPCTSPGGDGWSGTTHRIRRMDAKNADNRSAVHDITSDDDQPEELAWPELPPA